MNNHLKTRVLIVDDDPTILGMYQERLKLEGFEVTVAKNGEEGLARAVDSAPHIILLDLNMPRVGGFDTLEILKSTTETKKIPVIVLTAYNQPEFRDRAQKDKAEDFIIKADTTPSQIVEKIKTVLAFKK
jgi:CheY-like chemotaxis protein